TSNPEFIIGHYADNHFVLLLLLPLVLSCSKTDDVILNPPEPIIPDNSISIYEAIFWGYKLKDYSGFELHPLITGIDISQEHFITHNGLSVTIKNGMISGDSDLLYEIIGFESITQTIPNLEDNSIYLCGVKNDKLWIGLFDYSTKEHLKEWSIDNFSKEFILDLGYGEIDEVYIKNPYINILYQDTQNKIIKCTYKIIF
ncbi:MAG: hypothetical protein LUD02_04755, partial [Tannerellaceae bacterium]|nr:hypothetical protein [Tannerellaceae bacterium]